MKNTTMQKMGYYLRYHGLLLTMFVVLYKVKYISISDDIDRIAFLIYVLTMYGIYLAFMQFVSSKNLDMCWGINRVDYWTSSEGAFKFINSRGFKIIFMLYILFSFVNMGEIGEVLLTEEPVIPSPFNEITVKLLQTLYKTLLGMMIYTFSTLLFASLRLINIIRYNQKDYGRIVADNYIKSDSIAQGLDLLKKYHKKESYVDFQYDMENFREELDDDEASEFAKKFIFVVLNNRRIFRKKRKGYPLAEVLQIMDIVSCALVNSTKQVDTAIDLEIDKLFIIRREIESFSGLRDENINFRMQWILGNINSFDQLVKVKSLIGEYENVKRLADLGEKVIGFESFYPEYIEKFFFFYRDFSDCFIITEYSDKKSRIKEVYFAYILNNMKKCTYKGKLDIVNELLGVMNKEEIHFFIIKIVAETSTEKLGSIQKLFECNNIRYGYFDKVEYEKDKINKVFSRYRGYNTSCSEIDKTIEFMISKSDADVDNQLVEAIYNTNNIDFSKFVMLQYGLFGNQHDEIKITDALFSGSEVKITNWYCSYISHVIENQHRDGIRLYLVYYEQVIRILAAKLNVGNMLLTKDYLIPLSNREVIISGEVLTGFLNNEYLNDVKIKYLLVKYYTMPKEELSVSQGELKLIHKWIDRIILRYGYDINSIIDDMDKDGIILKNFGYGENISLRIKRQFEERKYLSLQSINVKEKPKTISDTFNKLLDYASKWIS